LIAFSELLKQDKWEKSPLEKDIELFCISENKKEELKQELRKSDDLCGVNTISNILKAFEIPFVEEKLVKNISEIKEVWENR